MKKMLLILVTVVVMVFCDGTRKNIKHNDAKEEKVFRDKGPAIPYDFANPVIFSLPDELREISGIVYSVSFKSLMAINDEKGILFELDTKGKILRKETFHKDGDYEDIALVNDDVYVLKSNGTLYKVTNAFTGKMSCTTYKSPFSEAMEFESLFADTSAHQLVVLIKDGESLQGKAPAYPFDLKESNYKVNPVLLINPLAIRGMEIKGKNWKASAMARHPLTGEWYILSSVNSKLLVCDAVGNGRAAIDLPKTSFAQPEGICFLPNGDLYISNEGNGPPANLMYFKYRPK